MNLIKNGQPNGLSENYQPLLSQETWPKIEAKMAKKCQIQKHQRQMMTSLEYKRNISMQQFVF